MVHFALSALRFGLDASLKATILLALVLLLAAAWRPLSAATRHLIAVLGLAGVLALPLAAPFVPSMSVPLVPSLLPAAVTDVSAAPDVASTGTSSAGGFEKSGIEMRASDQEDVMTVSAESSSNPAPAAADAQTLPRSTANPGLWAPWILLIWGAGAAFSLTRLALGWMRIRAISRAASPMADTAWTDAARALSLRLSLRRSVRLLTSPEVPVAMTAGLRRPVLLLHENARKWPEDRRRVVLLHELAHVRRADWLTLLLVELAAAVYWFHPLVWLARREARMSAERACDDLVLDSGTKPSVYAAHLLGIVRSFSPGVRGALPVLAIARPSQFEGRMRAILAPGLHRRGPTRGQIRVTALGLFTVVLSLASLEPWAPRSTAEAALSGTPVASSELPGSVDPGSHAAAAPPRACPQSSGEVAPAAAPVRTGARSASARETEPEQPTEPSFERVPSSPVAQPAGFVLAGNGDRSGSRWYSQAMDAHRDERYDDAIAGFAKAIELGYKEGASSYNIACGYALKGNAEKAFEWLRRAERADFQIAGYLDSDDDLDRLRSDPRFAALKQEARQARLKKNRDEGQDVRSRYESLASRSTASGDAWFSVGRELLHVGENPLAARAFARSAELGNRVGTSYYNEACGFALAGDKAAALDSLQKALENGFDDPDMFRRDDDLDAVRNEPRFRQIESLADDLAMPSIDWSSKLLRSTARADWTRAARRAREVASRHPQMGRVWFTLGYAEIRSERPAAAAEAFQKALDLGYRKPASLYNLACSYAQLDQKDRAFDFLFRALAAGFHSNSLRHDEDLDKLRGDPRFRKAEKIAEAREKD
ncbi:MAG: M56 family metallopeptidase [Thermoanaerobaculia bacterium]